MLLIFCAFLPAKTASLIGVCSNAGFSEDQCPANLIAFPAYEANNGTVNFLYRIDRGSIGDLDEATATQAVDSILDIWENVSNIDFIKPGDGQIEVDVDGSNFNQFVDPATPLGFSPIIFDDDGSLTNNLIGNGAKNSVLGFAGATFFDVINGKVESIVESQSMFNGFLFSEANRGDLNSFAEVKNEFDTTILHEFGHMLGIDHAQGGELSEFLRFRSGQNADVTNLPIMFPVAANPLIELQRDDIAAISIAYPKNSIVNDKGTIKGRVSTDGIGTNSVNVIAFNTNNPQAEVISCPSDVDGQGNGAFELPGLVAGDYILKVEPIFRDFDGGSNVGLHGPPNNPADIPTGFLDDNNDLVLSDDINIGLNQGQLFTVNAGETVENINIELANGNGGPGAPTFSLKGKSLNKAIRLKNKKKKNIKFKIRREDSDLERVVITTDFPNLVTVNKPELNINKKTKKVKVAFASFQDFLAEHPQIILEGLEVKLTVEDADTGYINDTETFFIF